MSSSKANTSFFSRIDGFTFFLYLLLVIIGISAIFSVDYRDTDSSIFLFSKSHTKQLLWLGISLFIGLIILFTDSKAFSTFAFLSYFFGIFLLIITIFLGTNVKGSHSWLGAGAFRFQPGEVCKIFTALALAKFFTLPEVNYSTLKYKLLGFAVALTPALLIILQNETGLALVYFSFVLVMYREGLPGSFLVFGLSLAILTIATLLTAQKTLFIVITCIALILIFYFRKEFKRNRPLRALIIGSWMFALGFSQFAIPFVFKKVLQNYQIERIYNMLGQDVPEQYIKEKDKIAEEKLPKKKDGNYNVKQSKIAIGSGGFLGKGWLNGTSTRGDFVPEQHTDFIFCSIGEQFGFLGSFVLIAIYILLMLRILKLAERQRSTFSRVYAYCVACILFFHFAVNISMTIGLAPVIGITLPFLSYGGSSLMSFSILLFILLRLDADRQVMVR